jgi:O-antigen/teichoic acid export membrane protein
VALAGVLFTLGVPEALTYFVASGKLAGKSTRKIASIAGLVCAIAGCVTLFFFAPHLFRGQPRNILAFHLLLFSLPATLLFAAYRGIAQGRQLFRMINRERVFSALLRLALIGALVFYHALSPAAAVWVTILSGLMGSLFLIPAVHDQSAAISRMDLAAFTSYAGSAALANFGGLLVIRLDQVLMVSLTSRSELAFYAVAASLAELPLAVVSACRDLAFSVAAERDDPLVIARFCRLTLLVMIITCLAGGLATPFVLPPLFGKSFSPACGMAEILLLGTVARAVTAVIGAGLMTVGRTWIRSGIQIGGAGLTALLIFALVPRWGGMGAAITTALTYAALAAASLFVYARATGVTARQCLVPELADIRNLRSAAILTFSRKP